jgi:hypothetical protein
MIALMVQILAPIGASFAFASAVSDPLAAAEICLSHSPAQGDEGGQQQTHDASCLICCSLSAGSAALATPEPTVWMAPDRSTSDIVWRDHAPQLADSRVGSNAQARAPPFSS